MFAKIILAVVVAAVLCGCASSHKFGDGFNPGGGGYSTIEIADGVWFISVETNFAPVANHSTAHEMWATRAREGCHDSPYTEYQTDTYVREQLPAYSAPLKYLHTGKRGYAVCGSGEFSEQELAQRVGNQEKAAKAEALAQAKCEKTGDEALDASHLFAVGKYHYDARRFDKAKVCFELSADATPGHRESMKYLGLMYELGKGVPKSMETAKLWYQRAGLIQE